MESDKTTVSDKQPDAAQGPNGLEKAIDVAKYPISVAAGLVWANRHARNEVYDVLVDADTGIDKEGKSKGYEGLKESYKVHKERLEQLGGNPKFRQEVAAEHKTFRKAVSTRLKANGYERPWHLVEGLSDHQRFDTLLAFATAFSITLGVISAAMDNKSLMEKFTRKDRNAERG